MRLLRGALPSPRHILSAAEPHKITVAYPPQFITIPKQLSMWGNDEYGDCIAAEEAFVKSCNSPEILISDTEVINWANSRGYLNGANLVPVMTSMQKEGFSQNKYLYNDGPHKSVDWTNTSILQSAISQGPVKLGIAADQIETVCNEYPNFPVNGWFATGFKKDKNEDHCVSLCGYGTISWLAQQLKVIVPKKINAAASGYAMFTWSSIGIIDVPSLLAITGEAWVRHPSTIIVSLQ